MDKDSKRRQVTLEQLTSLLDFLKEHQELARGLIRGKFHTVKIWNLCAKKVNAVKDGAIKDGRGWSKYWCDWKYRVRRHALDLNAARHSNTSVPDSVIPLSPMEETILSIIGGNEVDGVVIKSDPLGDEVSYEEEPDNNEHCVNTSINQYYNVEPIQRRKRRHSSKDHMTDLDDHGGPSSPLEKKHMADRNGHYDDSDHDDEASEFLRLEREKLDNSKRIADSLQTMRSEITRLADIMGHIRDILTNNRINL